MEPSSRVCIVVRPGTPASKVAPRVLDLVDDFAADVGRALGIEIPVVEGNLDAAPSDGLVIIFGTAGLSDHRDLCRRAVVVNIDRSLVPGGLEDLQVLGAIEKHRYFMWLTERDTEDGSGLFARKEIAKGMGAEIDFQYASDHYALVSCDRYKDLATLLAGYIAACFEVEATLLGP